VASGKRTKADGNTEGGGSTDGTGVGGSKKSSIGADPVEPVVTRRSRFMAVDNVALMAEWDDAKPEMTGSDGLLHWLDQWLRDHHGTIIGRGYYVMVLRGDQYDFYDSKEKHLGQVHMAKEWEVRGPVGAYTEIEVNGQSLYASMAERHVVVGAFLNGRFQSRVVPIAETLSSDADRRRWYDIRFKHSHLVPVLYKLAANRALHLYVALHGGAGVLEDYSSERNDLFDRIHERNKRVIDSVNLGYKAYLNWYINDKVNKAKTIPDLRKVGPPQSHFVFPRPGGLEATGKKWIDMLAQMASPSEFQAWRAVAERIAAIQGRHMEGSAFLRLKIEAGVGAKGDFGGGEAKISFTLDLGDDGMLTKSERTFSAEASLLNLAPGGSVPARVTGSPKATPVASVVREVNTETGAEKTIFKLGLTRAGKTWGVEIADDGETKIGIPSGPGTVYASWNPLTAEGGFGFCMDLARFIPKSGVRHSLGEIPSLNVCLGFHFVLITQETLLAFLCRAPGFFEQRFPEEFVRVGWSSLTSHERRNLEILKWTQDLWEQRYQLSRSEFPDPCQKQHTSELTADQLCAAVRLWFREHNWDATWRSVAKKS
jgi:hypothetical protein